MIYEALLSLIPADRILTSESDKTYYGKDSCKDFPANPSLVVQPCSVEEVSAVLKFCNEHKIAVVPSGGRTGYSGGATATNGELILSLARMNKILSSDINAQTITCQAGVTTETLQQEAQKLGLFYGVDFASKGSSHIGGNIATNAGGIRVIRYGNTRNWVLGLKVVIPSGEVLELNGALVKNQTGYDLRNLFIGSEGTLGIIVEATIQLATPPKESITCLCGLTLSQLLPVLHTLRSKQCTVNVFEYFDAECLKLVLSHTKLRDPFQNTYEAYALIELETPQAIDRERIEEIFATLLEAEAIGDVVIAQSEQQRSELISYRERISESIAKQYIPHKNDISVPVAEVVRFIPLCNEIIKAQYSRTLALVFGHIGDGNLHVNVLKPEHMTPELFFAHASKADHELFKLVQSFKGSISAEHGVGLLKKPYLQYSRSEGEISLMKQIKKVFDPNGICNPGKIFD